MIELVAEDRCTGCSACSFVCPKQCISMTPNNKGAIVPNIDHDICISCHKCQRTCPILNPVTFHEPQKAYAAWSSNAEERRTSASGGIAAEIYNYGLSNGFKIGGAVQNEDFSVALMLGDTTEDITKFKNSKYVFSTALNLYSQVKEVLNENKKCVIICLPCQIAAIRKIFGDNKNLFLADVVCHGTTPAELLKQHIQYIECKTGKKAASMSFRDSKITNTDTFTLAFYDKTGNCFYHQPTETGNDTYNFCYHKHIGYRENCYNCPFAQSKRVSDITLSDYKGLGALAPFNGDKEKVSSVLVMTEQGKEIFEKLINNGQIVASERPIMEPILGDPQLREASKKDKYYKKFIAHFTKEGNFEKAIAPVYREYRRDLKWKRFIRKIKSKTKKTLKLLYK